MFTWAELVTHLRKKSNFPNYMWEHIKVHKRPLAMNEGHLAIKFNVNWVLLLGCGNKIDLWIITEGHCSRTFFGSSFDCRSSPFTTKTVGVVSFIYVTSLAYHIRFKVKFPLKQRWPPKQGSTGRQSLEVYTEKIMCPDISAKFFRNIRHKIWFTIYADW